MYLSLLNTLIFLPRVGCSFLISDILYIAGLLKFLFLGSFLFNFIPDCGLEKGISNVVLAFDLVGLIKFVSELFLLIFSLISSGFD